MKRLPFLLLLVLLLLTGPAMAQAELPSWVEVYFTTPTGSTDASTYANGPDVALAAAIDAAATTVDVAAFELNADPIAQALLNAHARGVTVRIVTDNEHGLDVALYEAYLATDDEDERADIADEMESPPDETLLDELYDAGIPIVDDGRSALMHNKFIIIDSTVVWTGSINLTVNGSYRNNNNLVSLRSFRMVQNYQVEFDEMFETGQFGPRSISDTPYPVFTQDGTPIEVYFAPEDDVVPAILDEIAGAQESIRFMAFSFTLDEVRDAMLARAAEGVTVQGIFETTGSETSFSELTPIYCAGHDARQDGNPFILHHKVIIIDDETVLIGSFNFSDSATRSNDENLVIIHDAAIAARYVEEFRARLHEAAPPDDIACDPPRPANPTTCTLRADDANIRSGPGTDYLIFGQLIDGRIIDATGQDASGDWYAVDFNGLDGWVVGSAVDIGGGCTTDMPVQEAWNCDGNLYNCSDFATCEDVTNYFLACPGDPSRLDPDSNGQPCESLCRD